MVTARDCLKIVNIFLLIVQCILDFTRLRWDMVEGRGCRWCSPDCVDRLLVPLNPFLAAFWILWSVILYISNAILVYAILKVLVYQQLLDLWHYVDSSFVIGMMKCVILLIDLYMVVRNVGVHSHNKECEKLLSAFFSMDMSSIVFVMLFFAIASVQILIEILLCLLVTTSPEGRKYAVQHYLCSGSDSKEHGSICRRAVAEKIVVFLIWLVLAIYFYLYALSVSDDPKDAFDNNGWVPPDYILPPENPLSERPSTVG